MQENEHADSDQQDATDDFNGVQVTAKTAVKDEESVHAQRRQQEGYGQAQRIDCQQQNSLEDGFLGSGKNQDGRQNRTNARRPTEGKGETDGKRPKST